VNDCGEFSQIRQIRQSDFGSEDKIPVKMVAFHALEVGGKKKMKHIDCNLRKKENEFSAYFDNDKIFYHDCDTNGMASGGIIYQEVDGVKYVLGIHLGGTLPVNYDGSISLPNGKTLEPGIYEKIKPVGVVDGSVYNELFHANVMVSMWGNPSSTTELSPAALWNQMF
jgi:hypothetical protein